MVYRAVVGLQRSRRGVSDQSVPTTFVGLCPCSSPPRAGHPLLRYCSPPSQRSRPVPGAPGAAGGPWPPDEA